MQQVAGHDEKDFAEHEQAGSRHGIEKRPQEQAGQQPSLGRVCKNPGHAPTIGSVRRRRQRCVGFRDQEHLERIGAGSRDRTGILSLEGCCTTIVLYPRQTTSFSGSEMARRGVSCGFCCNKRQGPKRPGNCHRAECSSWVTKSGPQGSRARLRGGLPGRPIGGVREADCREIGDMVEGAGFEPAYALAARFTVWCL